MADEEIKKDENGSFIQKLKEDPVKLALLIVALLSLVTTIYLGTRSKGAEAEKTTTHMTMDPTPKPSGSLREIAGIGGYNLGIPLHAPGMVYSNWS